MKTLAAMIVAVLVATEAHADVHARRVTGGWMIVGGIVTAVFAYDWDAGTIPCGGHKFDLPYPEKDYCATTIGNTTTVREGGDDIWVDARMVRPGLMWAGASMVVGGIILAAIPKQAQKVTVAMGPKTVRVSKTITFGR
jgi:hypothetical protein